MNFKIQRYSVNQYQIQTLLTWINSGEIVIPEIWRPFVWSATKVRIKNQPKGGDKLPPPSIETASGVQRINCANTRGLS